MPEVIDAINRFRTELDRQAGSAAVRLAEAWREASRSLEADMAALAREVTIRRLTGQPVTMWHIARMNRYQALMQQIGAQLRAWPLVASGDIYQAQATHAALALNHSQRLLDLVTPGIVGQFDRLNVDAVRGMLGNTGAGTPLERLLRDAVGTGARRVGQQLVLGVTKGYHPERVARLMVGGLNLGLTRSILIARTETMRVYREASRQQYIHSGLVRGYRRIAAKSSRTCIACLMADGRFYELDVPFEEHPAGRCTMIPVTLGRGRVSWETGEQWFRRQDAATQREILGPGRFAAWQAGRFDLDATVKRIDDPAWGASLHPTPLRELV